MSRRDIMGLGPFLKGLEHRLGVRSKDELGRILLNYGRTLPAQERLGFLALFEQAPPTVARQANREADLALLADARAFIDDLEKGKYYEGSGFDRDVGDYCSYGDESWVDEMDALFERAGHAFLSGQKELAAEAYGLLLHAFDLEEGEGHFCGATSATEMVGTDLSETKARYLRALYETTPARQRPARLLEELHALRHRGAKETGIRAMRDADTAPLSGWKAFLDAWVARLRARDSAAGDIIMRDLTQRLLREAVMLKEGLSGLARLADEYGAEAPSFFQEWMQELIRQERREEACEVARRAATTVRDARSRADFAEQWAALASRAEDVLEARRLAWRCGPSIERLLRLRAVHAPTVEEAQCRMEEELVCWRNAGVKLNDRLAAVLLLLTRNYDDVAAMLTKANALGWSSPEHPGTLAYPVLLLAAAGTEPLPKGSVLAIWRHEIDAAADDAEPSLRAQQLAPVGTPGKGLWIVLEEALKCNPLADDARNRYLDLTRNVMLARSKKILEQQHRGAYDRAARMLVGWIEAARRLGRGLEAEALLEQIRKEYSRRPAFRREIDLLIKSHNNAQIAE